MNDFSNPTSTGTVYNLNEEREEQIIANIKDKIINSISHDDALEKNRKLHILFKHLHASFTDDEAALIALLHRVQSNDTLLFGHIQQSHESLFNFLQNTTLRLFAAENHETLMVLNESLNEMLDQLILNEKNEDERLKLLNIKILMDSFLCMRYMETTTDAKHDEKYFKELGLSLVSLSSSLLTAGPAPIIAGLGAIKTAKDVPVAIFHVSHKIYTVAQHKRNLDIASQQAGLSPIGFITKKISHLTGNLGLKTYVRKNKLRIGLVSSVVIGIAIVSFAVPVVGMILAGIGIAYSVFSMAKNIFIPRLKQINRSINLIDQQSQDMHLAQNQMMTQNKTDQPKKAKKMAVVKKAKEIKPKIHVDIKNFQSTIKVYPGFFQRVQYTTDEDEAFVANTNLVPSKINRTDRISL